MSYLGIASNYAIQKYPINGRNILAFSMLGTFTAFNYIYLFYEAATFQEYANSVYACAMISDGALVFLYIVWKMRLLYDCMNRTEYIVNQSEFFITKF